MKRIEKKYNKNVFFLSHTTRPMDTTIYKRVLANIRDVSQALICDSIATTGYLIKHTENGVR